MSAWTTRPETFRDVADVRRVLQAAFPTAQEAELVDALRRDAAWLPGLAWVAEEPGGRVVGYALLTRCHVGEPPAPALALAPVAVLPAFQRRGVGEAVTAAALHAAEQAGERLVIVLGHPEYYPRFGFTRASRFGIGVSFEVPDEALMALVLDVGADVPRGVVRYPAPFGV
ncbi:N-acetyltransferase [Actinomadura sp. NBRC 104425]|uniref:GNAT family N-acetyltransferase n=1 Tax=Actinomadura sp. NBRC 104425 TaxID=3032204 RepID=UPI0024A0BF72|nr:N-acetyltransferase [Actinomadura sp. NBRC 104425]GLZ11894.1 N-acetyltransferase [Actinomadura sp. NBRC 104425]